MPKNIFVRNIFNFIEINIYLNMGEIKFYS